MVNRTLGRRSVSDGRINIVRLTVNKRAVVGMNDLYLNGSKVEKMSVIMQDLVCTSGNFEGY